MRYNDTSTIRLVDLHNELSSWVNFLFDSKIEREMKNAIQSVQTDIKAEVFERVASNFEIQKELKP